MFKFFKDKPPEPVKPDKPKEQPTSVNSHPESKGQENKTFSQEVIQEYLGLASLEDLHDLKNRIEKVQGHIRIVVHPFFSRGREYSPGKEGHEDAYANAQRVIDTVLKRDHSSPVFLFEDADRATFPVLPEGVPRTSLITLPTYAEIGIPMVEGIGADHPTWRKGFMTYVYNKSQQNPQEAAYIFDRILAKSFDYLSEIFKYLGVKSVTTSGMYLGVDTNNEVSLTGCLGDFITELRKRNFVVDISPKFGAYNGDSKETLTELRNAGIEIKQTGKK